MRKKKKTKKTKDTIQDNQKIMIQTNNKAKMQEEIALLKEKDAPKTFVIKKGDGSTGEANVKIWTEIVKKVSAPKIQNTKQKRTVIW